MYVCSLVYIHQTCTCAGRLEHDCASTVLYVRARQACVCLALRAETLRASLFKIFTVLKLTNVGNHMSLPAITHTADLLYTWE